MPVACPIILNPKKKTAPDQCARRDICRFAWSSAPASCCWLLRESRIRKSLQSRESQRAKAALWQPAASRWGNGGTSERQATSGHTPNTRQPQVQRVFTKPHGKARPRHALSTRILRHAHQRRPHQIETFKVSADLHFANKLRGSNTSPMANRRLWTTPVTSFQFVNAVGGTGYGVISNRRIPPRSW
jgi:hypothetical protein